MGDELPTALKGGRYAIVGVVAEGSQAQTLDAVDKQLGAPVAIKRFFVRGARQWKDVELAEREARVLSALSHPALPAYLDHFEEDGALCLVMQKIEGESLAQMRARGGSLSAEEIWRFLAETGAVLDYLHTRAPPVIHRDIKPANVIRKPDGSFVVVDFGSVRDKLKPAGGSTVVGTFGYMAPEQFQGRASPASDVYAVGTTALVLLTGREPEDLPHRGLAIDVHQALAGRADSSLERVLSAMLDPDPDRRPRAITPLLPARQTEHPASSSTHGRASRGARRHAREERRHTRRHRRAPLHGWHGGLPWFLVALFTVGLLVARVATTVALRVFVPLLLTILAVLFGPALRRAAVRVAGAGVRANDALSRALRSVHARAPQTIETVGVDAGEGSVGARRVRVPPVDEFADDEPSSARERGAYRRHR